LMIEAAALKLGDRLLEVGAGSGYASAVASRIAAEVVAIERHPSLAEATRERLRRLGYHNVEVLAGDGSGGVPDRAPFDAIIVSAAGPIIPTELKEQLAIGGRLVMPVGSRRAERLLRITRTGGGLFPQDDLGEVAFVPLIGRHGWRDVRGPA
jgi:protein-L-isoaspartate(D-aspartate) O-methyltransferase